MLPSYVKPILPCAPSNILLLFIFKVSALYCFFIVAYCSVFRFFKIVILDDSSMPMYVNLINGNSPFVFWQQTSGSVYFNSNMILR